MLRLIPALALLASCGSALAEKLAVKWVELPVIEQSAVGFIELPQGQIVENQTADQSSRILTQPFLFSQRLGADSPVILRYQGQMRLQDIEDPTDAVTLGNQITLVHRPSLIVEVSKSFQASVSVEQASVLNPQQPATWSNTVEWAIQSTGAAPWKISLGYQESGTVEGTTLRQQFVRLTLDQPVTGLPVHLKAAPALIAEQSSAAPAETAFISTVDSSLVLAPSAQTSWAFGAILTDRTDNGSNRTFYSQLEQKLNPQALLRLRADYQKTRTDLLSEETNLLLGVDTAVSFTKTLQGAIKLQHKIPDLSPSTTPMTETVLSLSLSGAF